MIISQSFRSKLDNGSFGEETFYSTKSDLVFMSDKDGNSQSLTERIAGKDGIEASIGFLNEKLTQEIEDRIAAVAQEEEDRDAAIDTAILQEVTDRNEAIAAESVLRVAEESRIEGKINQEIENRTTAIENAVSDINEVLSGYQTRIGNLETFQATTEANLETIQTSIGTLNVDAEGKTIPIADQLANIIARLEVIEAQLNPTV